MQRALQLSCEKRWFLKTRKCPFSFSGLRVSVARPESDPTKQETLRKCGLHLYTRPDVQKFLGLASYYGSSTHLVCLHLSPSTGSAQEGRTTCLDRGRSRDCHKQDPIWRRLQRRRSHISTYSSLGTNGSDPAFGVLLSQQSNDLKNC